MKEDVKPVLPTHDEDEPDTSDIPELSEQEWAHAEIGKFYRPQKERTQS